MAPQRFSDGTGKEQHLQVPPFGPPAATLSGGLRPGSLRVHAPCKETSTDRASVSQAVARRGTPPLPPMSLGPCRCCLRKQGGCLREGEGRWAWTRRNLVCGRPGSRRRSEAQVGVAVLWPARTARRGSTVCRQTDPWNCSAGEDPLPEPFRLGRRGRPEGRDLQVLLFPRSIGKSLRGHREMLSSLWLPWGMRR